MVHQYDRHFELQKSLAKRYIFWDTEQTVESIANDNYCSKYHMIPKRDVLRGVCDSGMQRVISSRVCCNLCDQRRKSNPRGCDAFAFSEGSCYFKTCGLAFLNERLENFTLFRKIRKERRAKNLDLPTYLGMRGLGMGGDFQGQLDIINELSRRDESIGGDSNEPTAHIDGKTMSASLYTDFDVLTVDHVFSLLLYEKDSPKWINSND
jgi:hypothetical protein